MRQRPQQCHHSLGHFPGRWERRHQLAYCQGGHQHKEESPPLACGRGSNACGQKEGSLGAKEGTGLMPVDHDSHLQARRTLTSSAFIMLCLTP